MKMLNKSQMKSFAGYLVTVAVSIIILVIGSRLNEKGYSSFSQDSYSVDTAKVMEIIEVSDDSISYDTGTVMKNINIYFYATLLTGDEKGSEIVVLQNISDYSFSGIKMVEPGNKILVIQSGTGDTEYIFMDYQRFNKLVIFALVFMVALLLFGGIKGINALVSLTLTCASIFAVFIPAILSGKNVYIWTIFICLYTIVMTLFIISGFSKKSFAAIIGCLSGVFATGLLTIIMDKVLFLTGFVSEESVYLTHLPTEVPISLNAIVFAAITIGAMGAIMDVSMSISSALWEIKEKATNISFKSLLGSGITIGRDVMGTMANTLVLAYIGSSLSVILLLLAYSSSVVELLNREMIIVELLQAIVGSFGILITMPLTSLICAAIYQKANKGIGNDKELSFWEVD